MFIKYPPYQAVTRSTIKQADVIVERIPGTNTAVAYDREGNPIIASDNHYNVLSKAIDSAPENGVVLCKGEFIIDSPLTPRSGVSIVGGTFRLAKGLGTSSARISVATKV